MTGSSQNEFFLKQFQKVRGRLREGDTVGALEGMVELREEGFVNKELDSIIEGLRGAPPPEMVREAKRWVDLMIERLEDFGGDVIELVEEFGDESLGLSEAEWVPVDAEDSEGFELGGFEAIEDIDADEFMDLDEMGAEEIDLDLDFESDSRTSEEASLGGASSAQSSVELDSDDVDLPSIDFAMVDDDASGAEEVQSEAGSGSLGEATSLLEELSESGEAGSASNVNDRVTRPRSAARTEEGCRDDIETKQVKSPNASSAHDRSTRPNKALSSSGDPSGGDEGALFNSSSAAFDEDSPTGSIDARALDEVLSSSIDIDFEVEDDESQEDPSASQDHGFVDEPTRRGDSVAEMFAQHYGGEPDADNGAELGGASGADLGSEPAESEGEFDDEFDFDLGFENPAKRIETPDTASGAAPDEESEEAPEANESVEANELDDLEDFDFDLGFENPEQKTQKAGASEEPLQQQESEASSVPRDSRPTPAGLESVPRFRPPSEAESDDDVGGTMMGIGGRAEGIDDEEDTAAGAEATSPADEEADEAVLDDDEFYELAQALSEESSSAGPTRYRGEPRVAPEADSATPTPVPGGAQGEDQGRDDDTPNPFAHQAPTGVQEALVDSNSSFVLEEIRQSEANEAEAATGALMNEARRLYEKGKFESARDLLEAVLDRDAEHDEAQALLRTVEGELEREYKTDIGPLTQAPELNVAMSEIPNMNLDHRFGYLLSQIDGLSTFEDLLELSSMSRLETLEVLSQMLERDLIDVG